MATKYEKAKRNVLRNITFYSSSAQRGVQFDGFELLAKLLPPKKAEKALHEIKYTLRTEEMRYKFWVAVYRETKTGDVFIDTYIVERDLLTVPSIDSWLTGYIEARIDEDMDSKCLGYAWVGSMDMSVMYDVEETRLLNMFEAQGIYDQEKRAKIVQQYHQEQAAKQKAALAGVK